MPSASAIRQLLDRDAIRNCLYRYCRGIDRCDRELLKTIFWAHAPVKIGSSFNGTGDDLIEWVLPQLLGLDQTMHMLGNMCIELESQFARVETYAHCYHRLKGEEGKPFDVIVAGRYLDRFEKRREEWRICARVMIYDWFREYTDSGDWGKGFLGQTLTPGITLGGRKPDDPGYKILFG